MKKEELSFSKIVDEYVTISTGTTSDLSGQLQLSPDKLPVVTFETSGDCSSALKALRALEQVIICKSPTCEYSLINCDVRDGSIYPRFILANYEQDKKPSGLHLYLSGITDWFSPPVRGFVFEGETIVKDIAIPKFDIEVKMANGKAITFSNRYNCDINRDALIDRQTIVDEYITIRAFWGDAMLDFDEIRSLILDIQRLFSLLIGACLNIEYAWVLCRDTKESLKWAPFFFSHWSSDRNQLENWHEALVSSEYLFQSNKWPTILSRYFGSKGCHNGLWVRLVAMMGFKGFWEYEILGYVSILERYVAAQSKCKTSKLNQADFESLRKSLIALIDAFSAKKSLGGNEVIDCIRTGLGSIRNASTATFDQRFKVMTGDLDSRIKPILHFSDGDFTRLKELRNAAAHAYTIENTTGDLTLDMKLKDKLFLLLLHFAYLDLGLTIEDQIECLNETSHPAKRNADIDTKALELAAGHVKEIAVRGFDLSRTRRADSTVLEFDPATNDFRVSVEKSDAIRDGHKNPMFAGLRSIPDWVRMLYPPDAISKVEWVNKAYIKSGTESDSFAAHCLCIVYLNPGRQWDESMA